MAGFEVLDIINEPTAAAVAFGFQQGYLERRRQHRPAAARAGLRPGRRHVRRDRDGDPRQRVHRPGHRRRRAPGRLRLGPAAGRPGRRALPARASRSTSARRPAAAGKLWRECEDAKRTLSARPKAPVACDYQGKTAPRRDHPRSSSRRPRRTSWTARASPPCRPCRRPGWTGPISTACCWSAAPPACRWSARCSSRLTGKEPDASVAADEAVAHGAALHAGLILAKRDGRPANFSIRNVNSHSLGVVGIDPQTKRRRNGILIPRNTPLPVTRQAAASRRPRHGQRSILVQIVEGESPSADDCTPIGRCSVADLPPDCRPSRRWTSVSTTSPTAG